MPTLQYTGKNIYLDTYSQLYAISKLIPQKLKYSEIGVRQKQSDISKQVTTRENRFF